MANPSNKDTEPLGFKGWLPAKSTDPNAIMSVSLKLPGPLHRQLRLKALLQDLTLNEAIARAVEDWLAKP